MMRIENMYFSFNGVHSDAMGIKLMSFPKRQVPMLDATKKKIPRRNGFELIDDGSYGGIKVKQDIFVPSNASLPAVKNWLRGTGDLTFGDEPDLAYDAVIMTAMEFSYRARHLEGQQATITFDCQPFKHLVNEQQKTLTSGEVFNGQGHVNALPLIKIEGSGSGTLTINGNDINVSLTSGTPLYVDCDIGKAYIHTNGVYEFAGQMISIPDDWPELLPYAASADGYNNINFTAGITKVTITPRWRWL